MKKEMEVKYKTKEEKVKAFKDMLEEMGVSSRYEVARSEATSWECGNCASNHTIELY